MATRRREPDQLWSPLYRTGAVAAAIAVVLYATALVIVAVSPAPPESGGAAILEFVATHRTAYVIRQVLWLLPSLFLIVVCLALAVALRRHGPALAVLAGVVAVSSWAVSFAWPTTGDGSLAMVLLSDRYRDATTAAGRASFVAGAELLSALNDVPAAVGVLQTIGILLIALLMLRGTFGAGVAWLGVLTGAVGIVSELLRPILGLTYAAYGVLLFVWLAWVAVALWRLAGATAADPQEAGERHTPSEGPRGPSSVQQEVRTAGHSRR